MARRSREELATAFSAIVGDNNSDDVLTFLEDLSDSMTPETNTDDWENRYNELDRTWRQRYRDRFLNPNTPTPPGIETENNNADNNEPPTEEETHIEDLFQPI